MNIAMLNPGVERQVGTSLEDIRDDHKERYLWASERLAKTEAVLDAGCGVGYGSSLLAQCASSVHAIDISEDAIAYAKKYWANSNISHAVEDLCFFAVANTRRYDTIVAFEVVEHLIEPRLFLLRAFDALKAGGRIFVSVPNEKVIPHTVNLNPFHLKHYTPDEVRDLLLACGFEVKTLASQNTKEITEGDAGRFLILEAKRQSRRPADLDHGTLSQHALTQAANFVVARAMAIHKATKDNKTLKLRVEEAHKKLEEATRSLATSEPRSETQLKLLQFVEGLQAQTNATTDVLISDLMRRVKELESFERDLRERVMQAEVQRIQAEEKLRQTQQKGVQQTELMDRLSSDLAHARAEVQRHIDSSLHLKDDLRKAVEMWDAKTSQLEQTIREKDVAIQTADKIRADLTDERAALAKQRDDLDFRLQQVLLEKDQSDRAREQEDLSAKDQIAQLQEQITHLDADRNSLSGECERLREERGGLSRTSADLEHRLIQLQEELSATALRLGNERDEIAAQRDAMKKQASSAKDKSNSMAVRLLAIDRDNQLVMEANEELLQKLSTSETELSRQAQSTQALRTELQSRSATVTKRPPTLGNIYETLRAHRFYVPFFYKAVRNSTRNQMKRFRAKA